MKFAIIVAREATLEWYSTHETEKDARLAAGDLAGSLEFSFVAVVPVTFLWFV